MANFKDAYKVVMNVEGEAEYRNPNYKHGGKGTRLYNIWKDMRKRCNNPNSISYKWYGDKGIKVCDEWNDFVVFRDWALSNGYNDTLTIDREINDKGYCSANCRWVKKEFQQQNQSTSRIIEVDGEKLCINEASRRYKIHPQTIISRLNNGWSISDTLTIKPVLGNNQNKIYGKF